MLDGRRTSAVAFVAAESADAAPRQEAETYSEEWPLWKLSLVALPCLTATVMWSVVLPNSASYMLNLGMGPAMATLNNLAGPVCGFFTGPLVGAISDNSTSRYGRRRPVILSGLVATWISSVLFACAPRILSGSSGVVFAALMLWLLDVTMNVLQTPLRALVADLASSRQQVQVQVIATSFQAVGSLIGFSIMKMYEVPSEHMLELMVLSCALYTVAIGIQFSVAKEQPLAAGDGAAGAMCSPIQDTLEAVKCSSTLLRRLAAVHFLVWIGVAAWTQYSGHWFGICVFSGSPTAPLGSAEHKAYSEGQALFAYAGQCRSFLHLLSSIAVVVLLERTRIPPRAIYAACIWAGAIVSYIAAYFVKHDTGLAVFCMTLSVLPFVGSFSIPFGLIAAHNKAAEREGRQVSTALQMALLNCTNTLGQQVTTISLAALESSMPVALALQGVLAGTAAAWAMGGAGAVLLDDSADTAKLGKSASNMSMASLASSLSLASMAFSEGDPDAEEGGLSMKRR